MEKITKFSKNAETRKPWAGFDCLQIDWALTGRNQMPRVFRQFKSWMHLQGRKQVFDELCLDWTTTGQPRKELFEKTMARSQKKDADLKLLGSVDWSQDHHIPFGYLPGMTNEKHLWDASCKFEGLRAELYSSNRDVRRFSNDSHAAFEHTPALLLHQIKRRPRWTPLGGKDRDIGRRGVLWRLQSGR